MPFKTKNIDKETGKLYSIIKGTIHQKKKELLMCTHVEIVFKYIETNADKIIRKHEETYHWKIFETSLKK